MKELIQNTVSLEDFTKMCQKTVDAEIKEESLKKIKEMTPLEFRNWINVIMGTKYYTNMSVITQYVNEIFKTENYNPVVDYDKKNPVIDGAYKEVVSKYREVYNDIANVFFENPILKEKHQELSEYLKKIEKEKEKKIEVNGKHFVAIDVCDVLWAGWECDDKAWLVNDGGQIKLVVSDHGQKYFEKKWYLEEKIKEYENAIAETKRLIEKLS